MILLSQAPATCPAHYIFVTYSEQSRDNDNGCGYCVLLSFENLVHTYKTATWKAQTHPGCNSNTVSYVKVNQVAGVSQQSMCLSVCLFSVFCTAGALQHFARKLS
jgi:hypothetical protein